MPKPDGASELVKPPVAGRTFSARRRVRLADTDGHGNLRLDALFRYAQDVATDDAREVLPAGPAWVIRRALTEIGHHPTEGEMVELTTWCGGYGRSWAERRTSLVGALGGAVEMAAVWVALSPETGMPVALPEAFGPNYHEAANGRLVAARLRHPSPPPHASTTPWTFRAADIDIMGHVNNTAYWTVAEEFLTSRSPQLRAEAEFRSPIMVQTPMTLRTMNDEAQVHLWLTRDDAVHASIRVTG